MAAPLSFQFDFSSPHSCLASERIDAPAWRPRLPQIDQWLATGGF